MRLKNAAVACFAVMLAAGCGGGGGAAPTSISYVFVTPQVGAQRTYSRTIVDNSNNTINQNFTETVTAVNADGSYVVLQEGPGDNAVTVDGTSYVILKETLNLNGSGQETSYSYTTADGNLVTCNFVPHGPGPDFPVMIGKTWTLDYTFRCGANAPVSYTQVGSVADLESVTVPAGTFSALRLQSKLSWTDPNGTTVTQTVTNWRDAVTLLSVKEVIASAYSGTQPANGYAVSTETLLQSAN